MSVFVSGCVWRYSKAKGSNLLVLLAIADMAGDDGIARPEWDTSIAKLAAKTRLSRRNVQYCIRALQEAGELVVHDPHGPYRANTFQILVDTANSVFVGPARPVDKPVENVGKSEVAPMQPVAPLGCNPLHGGVQPVAPDPYSRSTSISSPARAKKPTEPKPRPQQPAWIAEYLAAGIKPELRAWARARAWDGLLEQHWEKFCDYMAQESAWKRYTDLDAAFRSCVRDDWGELRARAERDKRFGRQNTTVDLNGWWKSSDGVKAKGFAIGMPWDAAKARAELVQVLRDRPPERLPEPEEIPAWAWRRYEISVLDAVTEREGWGAWVDRTNRRSEYDQVCRRRKARGAEVPAEWEAEHAGR